MPGTAQHLEQAQHNERFFSGIDTDTYSDWAVIALFYSALHYVDAYLAKEGIVDPGGHDSRDEFVRRYPTTRAIWPQYRRLKSFSMSARYYAARFARGEVKGLERGSFEPIKRQISTALG